jgi:hypothetical protein
MPDSMDVDVVNGGAQTANKQSVFDTDNTVIFFDWDDTLLPSSFLSSRGFRLDTDDSLLVDCLEQFKDLENSAKKVLSLAMTYGKVVIVTNAEHGWVQLSAQKFMPGLVPLLNKFPVVSARSTYETMFPNSPWKWKFYAFHTKLNDLLCEENKLAYNICR